MNVSSPTTEHNALDMANRKKRCNSPTSRGSQSMAPVECQALPADFQPGKRDVICGRGIHSLSNFGNNAFRTLVESNLDAYVDSKTKKVKQCVVHKVIQSIHADGGKFVRQEKETGQWYEIGERDTKEKIMHAFRDSKQKRIRKLARFGKLDKKKTSFDDLLRVQREIFEGMVKQDQDDFSPLPFDCKDHEDFSLLSDYSHRLTESSESLAAVAKLASG